MQTRGSQIRETLQEANYSLVATLGDDAVIIRDNEAHGQALEVYQKNDHYAGHVLEINGVGYEFVRTALASDLESCSPIES